MIQGNPTDERVTRAAADACRRRMIGLGAEFSSCLYALTRDDLSRGGRAKKVALGAGLAPREMKELLQTAFGLNIIKG